MASRKKPASESAGTSAKVDKSTPEERAEIGRKLAEENAKNRVPVR